MRGQHELEREPRDARAELVLVDVAEALECIREGLARRLLVFRGVLPPAAQTVMLLSDVRELEVETESSQKLGLLDGRKRTLKCADSDDDPGAASDDRA